MDLKCWGVLSALIFLSGCAGGSSQCGLQPLAGIPITFVDGQPVVTLTLDGHEVRMLVDTEAQQTTITPQTAALIKARSTGGTQILSGSAGNVLATAVYVGKMQIGDLTMRNGAFFVTKLSDGKDDAGLGGTLGDDVFDVNNVALDFSHNRLSLYQTDVCAAGFPYDGNFAEMRFTDGRFGGFIVPVYIDGVKLNALIDTGAQKSYALTGALKAAGIKPVAAGASENFVGIGARTQTDESGQFESMTVGGETMKNTWLRLVYDPTPEAFDVVIGDDFLKGHELFLSEDLHILSLSVPAGN